jgi:serine protease inhibitor
MIQTTGGFGYSESKHFRAVRLPFKEPDQRKDCATDINRTNRKQKCHSEPSGSRTLLLFLSRKRFGLSDAMPHLSSSVVEAAINANKTELDVSQLHVKKSCLTPL